MQTLSRWVLLAFLVTSIASCGQKWSENEKENAEHFLQSLRLVVEAHGISNKGGPGAMPRGEFEKILSLYQRALNEANIVRDEVLDRAHPELRNNYRMYFQKGVELRIGGWTNEKEYDEIQGSALMDLWGDWIQRNRGNIKIPS